MAKVFVYGTLMRDGANHAVLARLGARFVGEAVTSEPRTLVDLGPYPAVLSLGRDRSTAPVHGEVWELEDERLDELDAFEGCPELYVRERLGVVCQGRAAEAFTYVFARRPPAGARVIPSGRYAAPGTALPTGARPGQLGRGRT